MRFWEHSHFLWGKPIRLSDLLAEKKRILDNRTGDAPDDLKPASGEIYLACKSVLELTNPGNDAKAFMRDTLAPLIKPAMKVYEDLKQDVFGLEAAPQVAKNGGQPWSLTRLSD